MTSNISYYSTSITGQLLGTVPAVIIARQLLVSHYDIGILVLTTDSLLDNYWIIIG